MTSNSAVIKWEDPDSIPPDVLAHLPPAHRTFVEKHLRFTKNGGKFFCPSATVSVNHSINDVSVPQGPVDVRITSYLNAERAGKVQDIFHPSHPTKEAVG